MESKFERVKSEELDNVYSSVLLLDRQTSISVSAGFMRDIIHDLKVQRHQVSKLGEKAAKYKKELATMKEGK